MAEIELEVFRGGDRASRGITAERLAALESFDCDANPVPIVIGHPKSDSPAEGLIKGFRLEGSKLFAKLSGLSKTIVDGVRSGKLINRSMAFFPENHESNPTPGKLAPRHLGFLGGSAPGIPGMKPLAKALSFSADDDDDSLVATEAPAEAIIFAAAEDEAPTPVFTVLDPKEPTNMPDVKTPEQIEADRVAADKAIKDRETAFAARVRNQFEAANARAIDALVAEGKVLPAEVDGLKLAFNALDPEAEELTFGAGDKATKATAVSHLFAFMATAIPKRVPLGKDPKSPTEEFNAEDTPTSPEDVTAKATALVKEKGLTFEAAVAEVTGEK